ncbi:MAG: hypothetical protein AAF229_10230 [Pseudomonadota bacterium]
MPITKKRLFILAVVLSAPLGGRAQDDVVPEPSPYINVTVELNGLAESAVMLNAAVEALSETASALAASPEDLTPEQLAAFTELTQQMNVLVVSLDQTIQGVGPAIRGMEAPTREVLVSLIDTARAEAIDPTLQSVDRKIRNWLVLAIVGALVVVGFTGLGLFVATRQLKLMAGMLRSIADDYEIVPKQRTAETAVPEQPASSDGDASGDSPLPA